LNSFSILPRNESFHNIDEFGFFASRPATPSKSRSRSSSAGGGRLSGDIPIKALSSIDTKENLEGSEQADSRSDAGKREGDVEER
jgi:glycerol-3-phosphate O-acyltransferase / dihydroxyacetone phosphate acyltransferase